MFARHSADALDDLANNGSVAKVIRVDREAVENALEGAGPVADGLEIEAPVLQELAALERVLLTRDGKRLTVHINPALLSGTS